MKKLFEQGYSLEKIAKLYKTKVTDVRNRLYKMGATKIENDKYSRLLRYSKQKGYKSIADVQEHLGNDGLRRYVKKFNQTIDK